jgi:Mor family transcriptional regulator
MGDMLTNLVELIGVEYTQLLLFQRGGQQVYFPQQESLNPDHWLVKAVGMSSATTLCRHLGKQVIILPLGGSGLRYRLQKELDNGLKNGASLNQLVKNTGLSRRTISRKRARLKEERPKMSRLF